MSFDYLWERLESGYIDNNGIRPQPGRVVDMITDPKELYIWDISKNDYVKVLHVIRNVSKDWIKIIFKNNLNPDEYRELVCTPDHPLHIIGKGRIFAEELSIGDKISGITTDDNDKKIVNTEFVISHIEKFEEECYSYDVTTESDRFMVNGLDSHNCRAFLSPYYERGGFYPADENDKPVFTGRWNGGAISLHLPMILAKARKENKDFYEVLDYYLELIRGLHKRTKDYLGELRASVNPLQFCEGGFYKGHLKPHEKIKPLLDYVTFSFGITALNELNRLYNGKSIYEDGQFPLEVMQYINNKLNEFKKEDHILYAVYGAPAESLCFSGDTEVQTYKGTKKIKDITSDDLVYSFNENLHKIELKKVKWCRKTRTDAEVVKVVMTNGQEIICTPDHPFAVRRKRKDKFTQFVGGEYIEYVKAKDLKENDGIKSNYIRLNYFGRPQCSVYYNKKQQLIQDINAEYFYGEKPSGYVTHHKDEDVTNNSFENLEYKASKEHRIHHLKDTIGKFSFTPGSQSEVNNSFYGKHHTEEAKEKNRKVHMGRSIEFFDSDNNHIGHFDCVNDVIEKGFTRHLVLQACKGLRNIALGKHYYKDYYWYYTDECEHLMKEANHKVKEVIFLEETYDVYDMEVEDNHNFFVGGNDGILVHNCGTQIQQFRKLYGIIENVSDREYVSNSFHCHVTEDINPIQKQDSEFRFWDLFAGGRIQYVKYPISYNLKAIKTLVRRAMKMGLYEGVNLSLSYCEDCGHEELNMDICPKCGSSNLIKIDRMNGYLSYSRVHGDTRLNAAKMAEISERKSM